MTKGTVLRLYHSAVVPEYRERERLLRERHGWDVHVACPPAWPEGGSVVSAEPDPEVPVHVLRVHGRTHPILFWYASGPLRRLIRELRPAIVDIHEEPYSLAALGAVRAATREAAAAPVCVYTAQNIHKRYPLPFRLAEQYVLDRAAAAYPCSSEAGAVLRRKGFRGRLEVLPLGVSPVTHERPAANGSRRVGFVGRLVPEKGGAVAVEAFAASGVDAKLEIVGSGPDEEHLRGLAARLGLGDRIVFTGSLDQDAALERIRGFDVLVVPSLTTSSWKEQFGRVAAQALAAGTPVVASSSGSLPEVLDGCGELVPEGDRGALAAALRHLLGDDRRRAELAARGRRRAEHLSWERVAAGFDEMYREVLGRA